MVFINYVEVIFCKNNEFLMMRRLRRCKNGFVRVYLKRNFLWMYIISCC